MTVIKTTFVAMTIIGCDCDAKLCEYVGETPAQWSSITDCEAAMKHQVLRARNYDYPLISGICRTANPPKTHLAAAPAQQADGAVARAATEPFRQPSVTFGAQATAAEAAAARPLLYEKVLDGGRAALYRTSNGYAVVKSRVGRVAAQTVDLAQRSANWLTAGFPDRF
jgi:hypothetical protein